MKDFCMKRSLLILTLLLTPVAAWAADAAKPATATPAPAAGTNTAATAKPATDAKAPATDAKAATKSDDKKSDPETFVPSVKISEDLSVSFPADI